MRIAVHSASASVTRTMAAIVRAAGHQLATATTQAIDLVLVDAQHPPLQSAPAAPQLTLMRSVTTEEHALACPVHPQQLIQQLVMRHRTSAIMLNNGWSLDVLARSLRHPEVSCVALTEKECQLLQALAHADGHSLDREALLASVWGVVGDVDTHTLETHIYRLRAKLADLLPTPCDILTENGAYLLVLHEK